VGPVVHICRALDGIPLAIELAAGRLRSMSFADLAARLGDQMGVLARHRSAGGDDVRHWTLRMTLDWSYDLLTEGQQTLAQRLSVFAGGFRLDAVEALCGGDLDVLDGVDEAVAKSLVTFDGTTARYRLLEPLRQYLAERLEESGAAETVRRAHAEWVAGLCDRLGSRLLEDQKRRSLRLREESANIDLALRWALDNHKHEIAHRIVGSLGQYWYFYNHDAGRRWCAEVVESGADATPARRAQALLSAGIVAQHDDDWDRSIALIRAALAIFRAQDAATGQAASLYWLGWALTVWPDPGEGEDHGTEARRCIEEGLRLFTRFGDRVWAGWCRIALSVQAFMNEDLDRSEQLAYQVVQECSADGARHPVGQALCNLAYVAHQRGRDAAALEFLEEAAALYRDLDDPWQLAVTLGELAAQAAVAGRGTDGLRALVESARCNQQIGRLPGRSNLLAVAAVVHQARGQTRLATAALGAFDAYPARRAVSPTRASAPWRGFLAGMVEMTRARLDPAEVAAATAAARRGSLDELIDELIIQPAKEAV
jgi:tetratricopeptide (TPR) repeat protein